MNCQKFAAAVGRDTSAPQPGLRRWGCLQAQHRGVSPELVLQFLAWNAEAAARCEVLSPAGAAPGNVRSLFHSSTVQRACPGCLLEQVGASSRASCGCNGIALTYRDTGPLQVSNLQMLKAYS